MLKQSSQLPTKTSTFLPLPSHNLIRGDVSRFFLFFCKDNYFDQQNPGGMFQCWMYFSFIAIFCLLCQRHVFGLLMYSRTDNSNFFLNRHLLFFRRQSADTPKFVFELVARVKVLEFLRAVVIDLFTVCQCHLDKVRNISQFFSFFSPQ